ncbi:MAG: hypothetical protein IPN68_09100 [Bacteroidetes bacterium]|nr:hypothetical protein [Bacteroidota bacterium]
MFKKNISNKFFLLLLVIIKINIIFCQEVKISESVISIAEELAADEADPEVVGMYIDKLYDLYENPVRINSANNDEISRIFFLSDFQVKVLIDYVNTTGKIVSVYELPNLPGFDRETAEMMSLFITLEDEPEEEAIRYRWRNTLITNLTYKTSDNDSTWQGSPVRLLSKYKFTAGGFSGGFTAEKDPGEELLTGNSQLPDMLSAHLAYKDNGFVRRIVIGDYSARFGQGTNINTGIRNSLSLHSPGYMSARSEIRPYTSTDENSFFRGAGAEFASGNISLSMFYSANKIDATADEPQSVKSFYTSGLHNTSSSVKKKDLITDINYGINLSYNYKNFRAGAIWSQEQLSLPVKSAKEDPEKLYNFSGAENSLYSVYYNTMISRVLLYGELSVNESLNRAMIQGLTLRPSDRLSINLFYRNYEEGYNSLHGNGPGITSTSASGKTLLGNFTFEAAKFLFISGGCGIREYPWLRYRVSSPSYDIKKEIRIRYSPSDKFHMENSYNYHLSTTDDEGKNSVPGLKELTLRSITSVFRYTITENLTFGTRFYYKSAAETSSKSFAMVQDIYYAIRKVPVTLWLRFGVFNTGDWDSRIYIYENDLLYSYSIPALYGSGSRNYMMISWKIHEKAEIRFKYGISSNYDKPAGDKINEEFRLQIRLFI